MRIAAQAITADLIDRLPIAGGAVVLIAIIGVVTRLWLGAEARHRAELERIGTAHVSEIKTLKEEIRGLRTEVREVRADLEAERRSRWHAEDVAARRVRGGRQGNGPEQ